jgi:hypothetical protein
LAAANVDVRDYSLSDGNRGYLVAHLGHGAREFMSRNKRQAIGRIVPLKDVHVRAADGDANDFDEHITWTAGGKRNLPDFEAAWPDKNGGAHRGRRHGNSGM